MSSGKSKNTQEQYEKEFYRFLKSRILGLGGTIELQRITGHLSQVRSEVRNAIGSSKVDITNFLEKYKDTFVISNNVVSVINKSKIDYESDASSVDFEASLPDKITNGKGVIVKLMSNYGFLKITDPVKSSAYFTAKHFGFDAKVDLTECKLYVGTVVFFNAVKEPPHKKTSSKYMAIKVWKYDENEEDEIIHYSKKTQSTGVFDPINLEGDGTIQKVFPNFGFILVTKDSKTTVFFQKGQVANFENIVDLTKIFQPGDMVEFAAHRTVKKDAKARYQAVQVWKKSPMKSSTKSETVSSKSNSSTTSSTTSKSNFIKPGAFLELPGFHSKSSPTRKVVESKNSTREMIYDQPGKICPRGNNAVIKFGDNFSQLADGDSSVYYVCGTQVTEISWEFNDGDAVTFDAVKIKSAPGWKALLVWTGKKPDILLAPHLGDFSEYTDEETDEIPDDTDSSVSEKQISLSSHSSLKSVSMKSESSDLKTNKSYKESLKSADCVNNAEDRNASNMCFKERNLCNSPSVYSTPSSRNSTKDSQNLDLKYESYSNADILTTEPSNCSSIESKTFENSECLKGATLINRSKELSFENLNDCPRESKSTTSLSSCTSKDSEKSKDLQTKLNKNALQGGYTSIEFKTFKKSKNLQNKLKSSASLSSYTSDDSEASKKSKEFKIKSTKIDQDAHDEHVSEKSNSNIDSNELSSSEETGNFSDTLKTTDSTEIVEIKQDETINTASITMYESILGKITKAYSTFAEVASSELPNPVAFFWSIFYSDKISIEELGINDLRQILQVGDPIKFNMFEIVDDSGQSWQKISLAWVGDKPLKCFEITPNEFIQQNNLSVSMTDESQYIKPKKAKEKPVKKFLVICNEADHDDENSPSVEIGLQEVGCNDETALQEDSFNDETSLILKDEQSLSKTESCSDEESDAYHSPEPFLPSEVTSENSSLEFQALSDMICQKLLMSRDLFVNSKVDINSLSSEVVSLILQQYRSKHSCQIPLLNDSAKENSEICSCTKKMSKITEVQTICTGEIMSQNIFTEC